MNIEKAELKSRLSEFLHRASEGELITVTHNGQPLCQISPSPHVSHEFPEYLIAASRDGWLQLPRGSGFAKITPFKAKGAKKSSLAALRESRKARTF